MEWFNELPDDVATVYHNIFRRRDVRREFSGEVIDRDMLMRVLEAAHAAPSVGLTQPWDFHIVQDPARLAEFAQHVGQCRDDFAAKLDGERKDTFNPIRIEGIEAAGTGIVVTYDPTRGGTNILGRDTIADTGLMSVALAIQNLWLAATAEGIGMGWVSFYKEEFLADFIGVEAPVRPVGWLCLGPVTHLAKERDLEAFGWRKGLPLDAVVHWDIADSVAND
ncbi:5,6-dimethylbenzimidazole synthase [Corynebacterium sp. H113]|uniref:5,6-dimethylbenzimidazole synthase n=1 Tax=Corynebacterium sp. H113 TaxID=3133419 RepID=UPI0030A397AE